ncbi:MAG: ATP-binding protein [Dysgonamonadaceae bacterium]|jgi:predicted ATPase|nr:ATP-binding protein [Dysgonamonadaceae bacterium]
MAKIKIQNIGPIVDVDIEINKVNVIMGPQSSGKSTIAKVISFCTWLDKKFSKEGFSKNEPVLDYIQELKDYHRLSEEYFNKESKIVFEGDFIEIHYNDDSPMVYREAFSIDGFRIGMKDFSPIDNNSKIIYIPAERNFVSIIYNLQEYLRDRDNIQDFVTNWYEAKRKYSNRNKLNILDLGVEYYSESEDIDKLHLTNGDDIKLQVASSGLQAVVPLITMFDYAIKGIYKERRPMSVKERDELVKKLNELVRNNEGKKHNVDLARILDLVNSKNYKYSQIIVEEPEQNLFPLTQRNLVYYMLRMCNETERNHRLTLTTHSPYILYAINNCMLGGLVNSQLEGSEKEEYLNNEFASKNSWIDPKFVSVWEIEDGKIRNIQDKDNIISYNYFDTKMTELIDEYDQILNYYKDEK